MCLQRDEEEILCYVDCTEVNSAVSALADGNQLQRCNSDRYLMADCRRSPVNATRHFSGQSRVDNSSNNVVTESTSTVRLNTQFGSTGNLGQRVPDVVLTPPSVDQRNSGQVELIRCNSGKNLPPPTSSRLTVSSSKYGQQADRLSHSSSTLVGVQPSSPASVVNNSVNSEVSVKQFTSTKTADRRFVLLPSSSKVRGPLCVYDDEIAYFTVR